MSQAYVHHAARIPQHVDTSA